MLFHLALLAEKAHLLDSLLCRENGPNRERSRLLLPINPLVQFLAGHCASRSRLADALIVGISWVSFVLGPVALLAFFELQFLPYHSAPITWWHRLALVMDLALLWALWFLVPAARPGKQERARWRPAGTAFLALVSVLSAVLAFMVATFPGERLEQAFARFTLRERLVAGDVDAVTLRPRSWFPNRLVVFRADLAAREKAGGVRPAPGLTIHSLRQRNLERAVLTEADLPRADFTRANLRGAWLVRAHAEGAWFDGADLSGAQLDEARLQGASFYQARMLGASMESAHLQGGTLAGAQMKGAWLRNADLRAASLASVDLRWATLDGADLRGSNLYDARLQGAVLPRARLQGASLERAYIHRTDFRNAEQVPHLPGLRWDQPAGGPGEPPCVTPPKGACDAGDTADRTRRVVTEYIPGDPVDCRRDRDECRRDAMLDRLKLGLGSSEPLDWEQASKRRLDELKADERREDGEFIELWRQIACDAGGAPFALATIVDAVEERDPTAHDPMPHDPEVIKQLARQVLADDGCAARLAVGNELRMRLINLRHAWGHETVRMSTTP